MEAAGEHDAADVLALVLDALWPHLTHHPSAPKKEDDCDSITYDSDDDRGVTISEGNAAISPAGCAAIREVCKQLWVKSYPLISRATITLEAALSCTSPDEADEGASQQLQQHQNITRFLQHAPQLHQLSFCFSPQGSCPQLAQLLEENCFGAAVHRLDLVA